MGELYNRQEQTSRRIQLRNDQTPAEWKLWLELRGQQLGYKFRRQYGIGTFIVDFYCPRLRLAIEVDGDSHFESDAIEYDNKREKYLNDNHIQIVRFTNQDIYHNLDEVIETIKQQLPKSDLP